MQFSVPQGRAGDVEKRQALSLAACVAAALAFFFFVVVVYASARHQPLRGHPNCDSDDCMQHAFLLSATLNRSIDPCEDFAAFACSAWLSSTANSRSVQDDLWYRYCVLRSLVLQTNKSIKVLLRSEEQTRSSG